MTDDAIDTIDDNGPQNLGERDWLLEQTIEVIINRGLEIGVTLTIGGSVISGTLIGGKKYFEELSAMVAASSSADGDIASSISKLWEQYTVLYERPEEAKLDWPPQPVRFIHLRGARYFYPGSTMPSRSVMLWRGKLSAVDGFSLGTFSFD